LEGGSDAIGVGVYEDLFAALDEEADFGFGAGVAEQDAAFAVQGRLGFGEQGLDLWQGLKWGLVFNAEVALGL
jgi:hypothetical protein